ncbi:uncharacterized protein LOC131065391 [Cryptomeria japonica]|uniref:uncharacterized protein LOC131065391 n=1 Tax=Cryptomeria japonica TaxID=3369 RepID=UPI0025ACDD9E|nr:uncharacterized protein LOC131065391 [Cryptomeria japonica]
MEYEKIESISEERSSARLRAKERKKPIKSEENKTITSFNKIYDLDEEEDSKDNSKDKDAQVEEENLTEIPKEDAEEEEEGEEENNKSKSEHDSSFNNLNNPDTSENEKMVLCSPMGPVQETNNNLEEQLNDMKEKVAMLEKN